MNRLTSLQGNWFCGFGHEPYTNALEKLPLLKRVITLCVLSPLDEGQSLALVRRAARTADAVNVILIG